jgi:hypothetical protein
LDSINGFLDDPCKTKIYIPNLQNVVVISQNYEQILV